LCVCAPFDSENNSNICPDRLGTDI
jgi:hypothetical protein